MDLQHWINDGLMAIFFFVVALEIKREMICGDLSDKRKAALPVAAAVGGMIVPAGLYLASNFGGKGAAGWGIPMATDIAFAVAILALLGGRVPSQLRIFLATLPDVRDALDREESERSEVMIGRIEELARQTESPLERLERMVHPWTSYLVLPLFALVNAGVALSAEFIRQALSSSVTLGVMLGLVVGKVVGVTGLAWLTVRLGWATMPAGVAWRHITGAGLIGGVGFTVSLFITGLAFSDKTLIEEAKVGVLAASLIAALGGYLFLLLVSRGTKPGKVPPE
jgi:NhaA family Na+:H+ antiporter